jgi:hypothetical protein
MGWAVVTPWQLCPQEKAPVSIVDEAGPVWMGMKKRKCLAPTTVQTPIIQPITSHYTDYTQMHCCYFAIH